MNILLICDDYWHPGNVVAEGLAFLREDGHSLRVIMDAKEIQSDNFAAYAIIIFAKSDEISAQNTKKWETLAMQNAFIAYVENGGCLFVLHAGLVGHAGTEPLRNLIGSRFLHHPEQCPVTLERARSHPIVAHMPPVTFTDEHYFIELLADDIEILLNANSVHGSAPALYLRMQGNGRVCVFTPGHNLAVWQEPVVMQLIRGCITWLSGENTG